MGWLVCGLCWLALLIYAGLGWVVGSHLYAFLTRKRIAWNARIKRRGRVGQSQSYKYFKSLTVSHLSASHRSKQLTKLYPGSKGMNNVAKLQDKVWIYNSITGGGRGENLKESTTNTIKDKHN